MGNIYYDENGLKPCEHETPEGLPFCYDCQFDMAIKARVLDLVYRAVAKQKIDHALIDLWIRKEHDDFR